MAKLCKRQGDFAQEPSVAPLKTYLTLELANHILRNACTEPAMRGRRKGRPACFNPAQTEASVCRMGPSDFNTTIRCRERTVFCRVGCELMNTCGLPQMTGGSASALELSRPARASLCYGPSDAQQPKAAFVAGLRPSQLPDRAACQLPDQSTIIRVRPSLTGSSRPRGARSFASVWPDHGDFRSSPAERTFFG